MVLLSSDTDFCSKILIWFEYFSRLLSVAADRVSTLVSVRNDTSLHAYIRRQYAVHMRVGVDLFL